MFFKLIEKEYQKKTIRIKLFHALVLRPSPRRNSALRYTFLRLSGRAFMKKHFDIDRI